MEKRIETGWLLDFYGPLLTARQQALLRLYCEEDLSLAEIAAQEGVSRQAVHDAVRRGAAQLHDFEAQLGLLSRYRRLYDALRQCQAVLTQMESADRIETDESAETARGFSRELQQAQRKALRETLTRLADEEGFDGI